MGISRQVCTVIIGVIAHPLDRLSKLDCSTRRRLSVLKKVMALEISRRKIAARNPTAWGRTLCGMGAI